MTVLEHIFKHLKVRQNYSATCRIFNSLVGVWKCDQTRAKMYKVFKSRVTWSGFSTDEDLRVSRNILLQYTGQWQKQHFYRLRSLVFDTLLPKSSPEMSPRAAFLFQPNSATSIVLCVRCQWIFLKVFAYDEFFSVRSFKLISFIPLQVHPRLFSLK